MLKIEDLCVHINDEKILQGLNLVIKPGEVHAIMGPNGSGKSTLASVLSGRPGFKITKGKVTYLEEDLLSKSIDKRAKEGLFLAFQDPIELPGVTNIQFLKTAYNSILKHKGQEPVDALDFLELAQEKLAIMKLPVDFLYRSVNQGFSGGEKKKNEMIQMSLLDPKLCILDETDSGLDLDALKVVADGVNNMRDPKRSFLIITHYQRLLHYVEPDHVHVLIDGKIVRSGDRKLALELEQKGYSWLM